jgi:hypothetical protein
MYKYFPQNFVLLCSQSIFCPVDMTGHVPYWPFTDGTILAKTENVTNEKKSSTTKAKQNPLFKMIFWEI